MPRHRYDCGVVVALITVLSLTLVGCGASASPGLSSAGTLTGRVTAGPTCPVERPDHPCPPEPVSAKVEAQTMHGQVVASTHTDANGRFRFQLRPGPYTVVAVTPNPLPRCSPTNVTVIARRMVTVAIDCDTGIR